MVLEGLKISLHVQTPLSRLWQLSLGVGRHSIHQTIKAFIKLSSRLNYTFEIYS